MVSGLPPTSARGRTVNRVALWNGRLFQRERKVPYPILRIKIPSTWAKPVTMERCRSYAPKTKTSFKSGVQRRSWVGRYRPSQPRVSRIIKAETAMTPKHTASKPAPLTKIPGAKNNTKGIQPVTRPTLAAPVNRPTRMLSQRPRDPSPPRTTTMTGTKNAAPKTKHRERTTRRNFDVLYSEQQDRLGCIPNGRMEPFSMGKRRSHQSRMAFSARCAARSRRASFQSLGGSTITASMGSIITPCQPLV